MTKKVNPPLSYRVPILPTLAAVGLSLLALPACSKSEQETYTQTRDNKKTVRAKKDCDGVFDSVRCIDECGNRLMGCMGVISAPSDLKEKEKEEELSDSDIERLLLRLVE